MVEKKRTQKVLFLSDMHIAGKTSNLATYQAGIIELMTRYDHVCMLGDDWELFFVDKNHVKSMSNLLEVLTDRSSDKWQKDFRLKIDKKVNDTRNAVQSVIRGGKWFTSEFLERNPRVHLHKVEGNHEMVRRFRNEFDYLEEKYPNFEWGIHGIRLGDALLTHGHIPMQDIHKQQDPARLRFAEKSQVWAGFIDLFAGLEHRWQESKWNTLEKKQTHIAKFDDNLTERTGLMNFSISHNRQREPLTTMSWAKHVFFGHTHVKFDNVIEPKTNTLYHNTGAIVKGNASRNPEDLGLLEAELTEDGRIINVRPVHITKDKDRSLWTKPKQDDALGR